MNETLSTPSDNLVGGLCRELHGLRCRWRRVMDELSRCRQDSLGRRLRKELETIQSRRQELQATVREMASFDLHDRLALEFLGELAQRPLSA